MQRVMMVENNGSLTREEIVFPRNDILCCFQGEILTGKGSDHLNCLCL